MPRLCSSLLLSLLIASSASAVSMAWTPIGNPGNAPANTGYGAVGYAYNIGTYEVTNAQYAEFLNAKAASDPLGLYNESGIGGPHGITRSGSPGTYTYSAIAGRGDMPVNFVSFYDALRFANWMNNGQGSGDTETGAYTLLGGTATPSNGGTVMRNAGATIVLTSENEWYKAAYYNPSIFPSYFEYPAGSNTQTACAQPTATANTANCNNVWGDLTTKGSFTGSASPYGTFDQGGNVFEWNESIIGGSDRVIRGGAYNHIPIMLAASTRGAFGPSIEDTNVGFRVALIPEPSTGLLLFAGLLGLAGWRRARD